jgi:hypothetical protein
MELSACDASIMRRLRLELAAATGSADVVREVTKRLTTVAKAHFFVERPKITELATDLGLQRSAMAERVAKIDAAEALLWDRLPAFIGSLCGTS